MFRLLNLFEYPLLVQTRYSFFSIYYLFQLASISSTSNLVDLIVLLKPLFFSMATKVQLVSLSALQLFAQLSTTGGIPVRASQRQR